MELLGKHIIAVQQTIIVNIMTRSFISWATLSGLAVFSTLTALGQGTGFYVKGGIGPAFTEKTALREFNAPLSGVKVKFDPGFQFRVAAGYQITDWVATELETGVSYNTIKSIPGATELDGSLANVPVLANVVLQCPKWNRFVPFIGGGAGMASAVLTADDITLNGNRLHGTQSDAVFAYHGFAGLKYQINDRMDVSLAYRYFGTTSPEWKADVIFGGGTGKTRFGDDKTHSVTAAFSYRF